MKKQFKAAMVLLSLTAVTAIFQNCGSTTDLGEYSQQSSTAAVPAPAPATPAPKITGASTPGSVGFFQPASLVVTATGTDLTYQWYKNDVMVAGATAPTLSVASAVATDSGVYKVVVSNPQGVVESPALSLSVVRLSSQLGAPVITAKTADAAIDYVDVAKTLSVTATGVGLSYEWKVTYLDYSVNTAGVSTTKTFATTAMTKVATNSYVYMGTTYTYPIIGKYTVVVKNYFGETTSSDVNISYIPINIGF